VSSQEGESRPMMPSDLDRSKIQIQGGGNSQRNGFQDPRRNKTGGNTTVNQYELRRQRLRGENPDGTLDENSENEDLESNFDKTASELAELQHLEDAANAKIAAGKMANTKKNQKVPGFFKKMLGGLQSKMIKKLLKTNPMSHMSHKDLKNSLIEKFKGGKLDPVIRKYPKLLDFVVGMIRDPDALASLVTILDKQEKMLTYTYSFVGIFILSILLNIFAFPNAGWFKKIMFKLFITIMVPVANLGIFYFMFKKELAPTIEVAKKYLFS
jgi:hypothetical protein